jgi:hypothetical protein
MDTDEHGLMENKTPIRVDLCPSVAQIAFFSILLALLPSERLYRVDGGSAAGRDIAGG